MNWDDDSQKMWFMEEILCLSKFLNWSVLRSLAATSLEEIKIAFILLHNSIIF